MADDSATTNGAGYFLRSAREAARMTQQQLADASNVGVRTISLLETGRTSNIRLQTIERLAEAVGLPPSHLAAAFFGEEPSVDTTTAAKQTADYVRIGRLWILGALRNLYTAAQSLDSNEPDTALAKRNVADVAGQLFTLSTIHALETASESLTPELTVILESQAGMWPDPSADRAYLDWILSGGPASDEDSEHAQRWAHARSNASSQ